LPTPCDQLRVTITEPDANGEIAVTAYSVSDPGTMCIQTLAPFTTFIPMENLPTGRYTITINGERPTEVEITHP